MSIKTSQAILKCFINLKSSFWFTPLLRWAQKTKPCFVTRRVHILFAVSINFRAISNSNFLLFDISNGSKIKSEIRFGTELTDPGLNSISSKWVVSEKRKKIED